MSTAVEQVVRYCKRYGVLCAGANEFGYCYTTACWNRGWNGVRVCSTYEYEDKNESGKDGEADEIVAWMPLPEPWKGE